MNSLEIIVFDKNGKDVTNEKKWFVDVYGDLYYMDNNVCNTQSMNIDMEGNISYQNNEKQISTTLENLILVDNNEYTYRIEVMTYF